MFDDDFVIIALCLLLLTTGGGLIYELNSKFKIETILNTCQQSLPRDQVCILVAIPKKEF